MAEIPVGDERTIVAVNDVHLPPVARMENPYKDIDAVPDEDAVTSFLWPWRWQKRRPDPCFETPPLEELQRRCIRSFDFLKKEFGQVPKTPIGNNANSPCDVLTTTTI